MLNHPYWSALEWDEIIDLPGITCMEVYNHASEWLDLLGDDAREWDALLKKAEDSGDWQRMTAITAMSTATAGRSI